ncbi:MAG: YkgJ family cysteine cluster protein [Oleibacter sp.]|nr:YkgJ family cysteine cluster protein [Thalassolituus sp.]
MECRLGCGACCIAPSISSAIPATASIPGMPDGKPAGVRCVQLDDNNLCRLFGLPERPNVCLAFQAEFDVCGDDNHTAMSNLITLQQLTD